MKWFHLREKSRRLLAFFEWNASCENRCRNSLRGLQKGSLGMNGKYWKRAAMSLAMSAAVIGASSLANAQGRRGRGEERSQENQQQRDQRLKYKEIK